MTENRSSPYRCNFCAEYLHQQPLTGWNRLLFWLPVRTFKCPHCFNVFRRPNAILGALPGMRWLFGQGSRDSLRKAVGSANKTSDRSSKAEWKIGKGLVKLGRSITNAEQWMVNGLLSLVHKIFGKRSSRSGSSRKSRSSRKRSRSSTED
ncbi:MAG: hypothetical protein JNM43_13050 [Planctomycetaceae bacterium]|nr:hypothetical protein [Planctomycetaceae bacterium]